MTMQITMMFDPADRATAEHLASLMEEMASYVVDNVHMTLSEDEPVQDLPRPRSNVFERPRYGYLENGRPVYGLHDGFVGGSEAVNRQNAEKSRCDATEFTPPENEHIVLMAFHMTAPSMRLAQAGVAGLIPEIGTTHNHEGNDVTLESYWTAMDERYDGSDCDTAVFVPDSGEAIGAKQRTLRSMTPSIMRAAHLKDVVEHSQEHYENYIRTTVLQMAARGLTTKEIASALSLDFDKIDQILEKSGV